MTLCKFDENPSSTFQDIVFTMFSVCTDEQMRSEQLQNILLWHTKWRRAIKADKLVADKPNLYRS